MDESRRLVVPPRRSRWWLGFGLLVLGACGGDKPAGGGTGGMIGVGQGGGTGGASAPGTGGAPGHGGTGAAVVEPIGLQYNGNISFFRVVR